MMHILSLLTVLCCLTEMIIQYRIPNKYESEVYGEVSIKVTRKYVCIIILAKAWH